MRRLELPAVRDQWDLYRNQHYVDTVSVTQCADWVDAAGSASAEWGGTRTGRNEETMAKLTTAARKKISAKDFALGKGRYPIENASHARNALARVSQHGTPAEKAKVRAAVHEKYPAIGKDGRHMGGHKIGELISRQ
jgi:hypothetical protein